MTNELQKYYEDRFDMMSKKSWKDLIEDATNIYNEYIKVTSVSPTNSLDYRRGQIDILHWLISLEDVSKQTYEELSNEKDL